MIKKTVKINESKCNACCLCVSACQEGAIGLIGGKAKLLNDNNCHEFGRCLSVCPTKAITYEEAEEKRNDAALNINSIEAKLKERFSYSKQKSFYEPVQKQVEHIESQLYQWPVQIKLIASNSPSFNNANLLVAAECSAYVYANFHNEYMRDRVTIIGCPKLDDEDYSEKLADILKLNDIKSVVVARMEVPCCNGIEAAVKNALHITGNQNIIPSKIVTISTDGRIIEKTK